MNMEYDTTEATDDYFMLNGRSFPYTLRESLIHMEENQKVKLRVLNGHTESFALHVLPAAHAGEKGENPVICAFFAPGGSHDATRSRSPPCRGG
jgi:hypothetical protein